MRAWWRRFRCNWLDWHTPDGRPTFNGVSEVARCRACGRKILTDSNGDWFSVSQ